MDKTIQGRPRRRSGKAADVPPSERAAQTRTMGWGETERSDNLAQRAYLNLRDKIISCALRPGQSVVEAELAREFGISRSPLREALGRLEEEGFVVEDGHNRHRRVAGISPAGVRQLYELRSVLECYAANRAEGLIPTKTVVDFERQFDQIRTDLERGDSRTILDTDFAFHSIYISRCGNQLVIDQLSRLEVHLRRLWAFVGNRIEHNMLALEEHTRIADAMKNPVPGGLAAAVGAHVLGVGHRVAYFVEECDLPY